MLFVSLLLSLVLSLLWAAPARAFTYYVSLSGSDANSCTTARTCTSPTCTTAKLTIKAGMACQTLAGDILYIREGVYTTVPDSTPLTPGTSWSNVTTVSGYPGETVTWRPSGLCYVGTID